MQRDEKVLKLEREVELWCNEKRLTVERKSGLGEYLEIPVPSPDGLKRTIGMYLSPEHYDGWLLVLSGDPATSPMYDEQFSESHEGTVLGFLDRAYRRVQEVTGKDLKMQSLTDED